jgi:hypothetical protein
MRIFGSFRFGAVYVFVRAAKMMVFKYIDRDTNRVQACCVLNAFSILSFKSVELSSPINNTFEAAKRCAKRSTAASKSLFRKAISQNKQKEIILQNNNRLSVRSQIQLCDVPVQFFLQCNTSRKTESAASKSWFRRAITQCKQKQQNNLSVVARIRIQDVPVQFFLQCNTSQTSQT